MKAQKTVASGREKYFNNQNNEMHPQYKEKIRKNINVK